MTARRLVDLRELPSFARAKDAFAAPIPDPGSIPPGFAPLVREIAEWDAKVRRHWAGFDESTVLRRAVGVGRAIGDAMRFQRGVRTRQVDQFLAASPADAVERFENWRDSFFARCDALAALATAGLIASGLSMPEAGILRMALHNPARLGRLFGGRPPLAAVSIFLATLVVLFQERSWFRSFAARQLRRAGVLPSHTAHAAMRRLNGCAGRTVITTRHSELVLAVYQSLEERGLHGEAADKLVLHALEHGQRTSGKPWKGLNRLTELVVFSDLDPKASNIAAIFEEVMQAPIDYTHVPGREWIVRDYQASKKLMQMDGKIAPGDRWAGLQQGRGSLATGYLRAGQERAEFGRVYSKPLAAFLDSMVAAEGPDHLRMRKAFIPFFSQAAVLEHASFVEETVGRLLDHAAGVARRNGGAFDLRVDFAYRYPIRVICRMLDLPAEDVDAVQHWAEASVRAMDVEAGVSFATAREGQRAAEEFRAYLEQKLALARSGEFKGEVISTVARDETLSESERVANIGVTIFAGFETTTGLLSKGIEALLRHREQWVWLRDALAPAASGDASIAADRDWRWLAWAATQPERSVDVARRDRLMDVAKASASSMARIERIRAQEALLDRAIEEMLRWTAPGTVVPLTASKDVEFTVDAPVVVKGCPHAEGESLTIKRGETVAVAVDELNRRCPVGAGRFAGAVAAAFDVSREDNTAHLSFGLRHSCIGAFLAKENAKRALEGVLRRFPDLELAGDPIPQEMELFSGLASLPVWTRG